MQLQFLKNDQLQKQLEHLVRCERRLLQQVLLHIAEVERRKLYLELGFPSLFAYLTEHLQYSAGAAMRRIDAVRLIREVPVTLTKVATGEINLGQVSLLQQSVRQKEKQGSEVDPQTKHAIIENIAGKSRAYTEQIISQKLDICPQYHQVEKTQADASVRIELCFSAQEWQQIESLRAHFSHCSKGNIKDLLLYFANRIHTQKTTGYRALGLAKKRDANHKENFSLDKANTSVAIKNILSSAANPVHIQRKKIMLKALNIKPKDEISSSTETEYTIHKSSADNQPIALSQVQKNSVTQLDLCALTAPDGTVDIRRQPLKHSPRRSIAASVRREIFTKYKSCQFVNHTTGQSCNSQWQLQIEHIQPIWAGGSDHIDNLSLLCSQHNRLRYRQQSGIKSK